MKLIIGFLLTILFVGTADAQQPFFKNSISRNEAVVVVYPLLGENPFPRLTGANLEAAKSALDFAELLTQDCGCDKALAEYGIESLHKLMKMRINVDIFDGRTSTLEMSFPGKTAYRETIASYFGRTRDTIIAIVIPETFTGSNKMTFLNSYFFSPTSDTTTALHQRALILIHESVHQFAGKGDHVFGGSRALTGKLVEKCLPGLSLLNKLGKINIKD